MLSVLTVLLLVVQVSGRRHFRDIYPIDPELTVRPNTFRDERRYSYLICPPRAICGVITDFNRLVGDGYVPERRILKMCTCPSNSGECPFTREHRLYASYKRREYFCNPVSTLPHCPRRSSSKDLVEGDENFLGIPYFRINCICPRHNSPQIPDNPRGMELATQYSGRFFDFPNNLIVQTRICLVRPDDI